MPCVRCADSQSQNRRPDPTFLRNLENVRSTNSQAVRWIAGFPGAIDGVSFVDCIFRGVRPTGGRRGKWLDSISQRQDGTGRERPQIELKANMAVRLYE